MRWGRHGVFFSEARHRRRRGIRPWSRLQAADGNGRSPKWFNGGMVLAATAVRATVTEALRVGKTACHGHHFTAIGGPAVKPNRPFCKTYPPVRKSPRRNHNWNANRQTTASHGAPPDTIRLVRNLRKPCIFFPQAHAGGKTHLIQ